MYQVARGMDYLSSRGVSTAYSITKTQNIRMNSIFVNWFLLAAASHWHLSEHARQTRRTIQLAKVEKLIYNYRY